MRNKYLLPIIIISVLTNLLLVWQVWAGSPDSPGAPNATSSYTLQDLYNRLTAGTAATQSTFTEPAAGPGTGTMHTINEIMGVAPALDNTNGAAVTQVMSGTTYWGLRSGAWGTLTGTAILASGSATDSQVLSGVTYSNAGGASTGTMPNNGAGSTIVPTTTNQSVAAGYWSSVNTVQGDANLTAGNIVSGTAIFGVDGSAVTASGSATDSQVLSGVTYSNAGGASTGTMPNNGAGSTIVPTTTNQSVAAGYWSSANTMQGDANLVAGNIASGTSIFGVVGSAVTASGSATDAQVLNGISFSNSSGAATGTMPNNGAGSTIVPTTTNQSVAAGYWSSANTVQGDADLVAGNIASGTSIFGVVGSAITASGSATSGQVLNGVSFSNSSGAATGTMPNNGAGSTIVPTTTNQSVAAGYWSSANTVQGDADLTAGNIRSGVNLFGVLGTLTAGVPKTGQTACWDAAGNSISCTGTGQDGNLQRGATWPNPRFTDNGNGTVTDNLTGLIWLKNANCANAVRTWATALSDVASLNSAGTMNSKNCNDTSNGGSHQTDWRLPNVRELQSLAHYGYYSPAVPNTAGTAKWTAGNPFTSVVSSFYWSSSSAAGNSISAWYVYMDDGSVGYHSKDNTGFVWPVRGGQ